MYGKDHIIFTVTSLVLTIALLIVCAKKLKKQKHKDAVLFWSAIITVALHYSILYVDFLSTGKAEVNSTMLLPVYPCNVAMWLLLTVGLWRNKSGAAFKFFAEITFYLGVIGGTVGLVFNENYMANPDMGNWDIFKGLLSHSTLIFGCLYLLVGKYIRIRMDNFPSIIIGLVGLVADGAFMIALFMAFKLDPPNCMFLLENPFPQIEWFNPWLLGLVALIAIVIFIVVYEHFALKKQDRALVKFIDKLKKKEK